MFHRVKPESEQNAQNSKPATQNNKPDNTVTNTPREASQPVVKNEAAPTAAVESQTENTAVEQAAPSTPSNNTSQKDTETMNTSSQETATAETQNGGFHKNPTSYQRSVQQPPYATSYSSTSSYAPSADAVPASDRTLTIGRGITMSGEIEACDYLLVEGTVEAALKGASVLEISQSGTFYGTVEIEEATVAGRFEGDITVTGRLTIKSGGVITGSIAYGALEVETGAIIDGRLTPVAAAPAQAQTAPEAAPQEAKPAEEALKKAKEQNPEPANTDGELFSTKAAS